MGLPQESCRRLSTVRGPEEPYGYSEKQRITFPIIGQPVGWCALVRRRRQVSQVIVGRALKGQVVQVVDGGEVVQVVVGEAQSGSAWKFGFGFGVAAAVESWARELGRRPGRQKLR